MSTIDVPTQLAQNSNYYLDLISFSLLCYEYFITIDLEVSRYWGLRRTAPNVLFFMNRYGMLCGTVPIVFQYFWTSPTLLTVDQVCESLHFYHEWFAVASQIVIGVMLILRTYALYERNRRVLALMLLVSLGGVAVGAWAIMGGSQSKTWRRSPSAQSLHWVFHWSNFGPIHWTRSRLG
ncbi:hypothetical protein MSAN_01529500 [Mycena sanguinolenta]|uniref:DUF6533 domain-containing protein n=1 Tax=Mycena sanguinolenta TaxID=230812 RepID=A0A8H6Y888_9AGAR|nr:hypothetical protein MSAN_01529500 [Mycena sanguinolenta]